MMISRLWLTMVASMLLLAMPAQAVQYALTKGSNVSFTAKITASSFVAKSEAITGTADYDPGSSTIKTAVFIVKADSFDTGMGMRNAHMRDKYLEAAKFPEIRLEVKNGPLPIGASDPTTVEGLFIIKGVRKPAKLQIAAAPGDGGQVTATSNFKLNITDYGIPRPKFAVVKMEPVIDVTVHLVLQPAK